MDKQTVPKHNFESWYADQVTKEIEKGTSAYSVNTEQNCQLSSLHMTGG